MNCSKSMLKLVKPAKTLTENVFFYQFYIKFYLGIIIKRFTVNIVISEYFCHVSSRHEEASMLFCCCKIN